MSNAEMRAWWWFNPHAVEQGGAIYRYLGIRRVKRMLVITLGKVVRRANYSLEGRNREALRRFERWTIVSETYHLALFSFFAIAVAWVFVDRGHLSLQLTILGCFANLYLVCLQRYNRARIRATLQRLEVHGQRLRIGNPTSYRVRA